MMLGHGDFNYYVGKLIDDFKEIQGEYSFGAQNVEGRMLLEFCDKKDLSCKHSVSEIKKQHIVLEKTIYILC